MLKKIYEFIDDYVRNNYWLQCITFVICGILGFILIFCYALDSTPATSADYEPLIVQNRAIQENFNTVYSYDNYEIIPNENNINVILANEQCKIKCTYDKNFKFINYKEIDLAESKAGAIFCSFLFGFIMIGGTAMYVLAMFLPFILSYLLRFLEWICLLLVGRR